jgi:hypothetical protein
MKPKTKRISKKGLKKLKKLERLKMLLEQAQRETGAVVKAEAPKPDPGPSPVALRPFGTKGPVDMVPESLRGLGYDAVALLAVDGALDAVESEWFKKRRLGCGHLLRGWML